MLAPTKKRPIDKTKSQLKEARFTGDAAKIEKLKVFAKKIGLEETFEPLFLKDIVPGISTNSGGICIKGGRAKENITQTQLSKLTGISQRHLSEMENGKRAIGKESAKKLAQVLNVDYRVFL